MTDKVLLLVMGLFIFMSCDAKRVKGNGQITTKSYNVENYDKIEMAENANWSLLSMFKSNDASQSKNSMTYAQSNNVSLKITADKNLFDYIKVYCKNGKLTITTAKNITISPTRLEINGTSKMLSGASILGGSDFIVTSPLNSNELSIRVSGSGNVRLNGAVKASDFSATISGSGNMQSQKGLQCNSCRIRISGSGNMVFSNITSTAVEASISGSGNITLSGTAVEGKYSTSGSGDINASSLMAQNVKCNSSGSGNIMVYATDSLSSHTSGSGDIKYKGKPVIESQASGSSNLTRIKE